MSFIFLNHTFIVTDKSGVMWTQFYIILPLILSWKHQHSMRKWWHIRWHTTKFLWKLWSVLNLPGNRMLVFYPGAKPKQSFLQWTSIPTSNKSYEIQNEVIDRLHVTPVTCIGCFMHCSVPDEPKTTCTDNMKNFISRSPCPT